MVLQPATDEDCQSGKCVTCVVGCTCVFWPCRPAERSTWPHREEEGTAVDEGAWAWAGFGAAAPVRVTGLSGRVLDVALGGWHAMALLE